MEVKVFHHLRIETGLEIAEQLAKNLIPEDAEDINMDFYRENHNLYIPYDYLEVSYKTVVHC